MVTNDPQRFRQLKYYVACTVDGYICKEDGSFDCFMRGGLGTGGHVTDYLASFQTFDIVLMGRKTYEVGLKVGVTNPYPGMKSYVFSRTMKSSPDERVTLVTENAIDVVRGLKREPGKDIYLCGGGEFAAALLAEGLIDEILLKLNPFLLGSGIGLFSQTIPITDLELLGSKAYENGVLLLHYRVKK
jgi:dihydrofolate reductase